MSEPGSFLSRWSRRKRDAVAPPPEEIAAELPATDSTLAVAPDGAVPEPEATELALSDEELARLPPVDEIAAGTDLAPFLRAGVPRLIRNAALRRMWSVDPAIRDFLNDAREYAYDWNVPGGVPGSGPLLPVDDVAELLRRVAGGSGPEPDGDARGAADVDADRPASPLAGMAEGDHVRLATELSLPAPTIDDVVIGPRPHPEVLGHRPSLEGGLGASWSPPSRPAAQAPQDEGANDRSDRVLRRHGGAMPN